MEHVLRPDKLDLDPQTPEAGNAFELWLACFESYVEEIEETESAAKRRILLSRQRPGESSAGFVQALQTLVRTCDCRGLTAEQHAELLVRDAFVTGTRSVYVRQQLLEHADLTLRSTIELADTLEAALHNSDALQARNLPTASWMPQTPQPTGESTSAAASHESAELVIRPVSQRVTMASGSHTTDSRGGCCVAMLVVQGTEYRDFALLVMPQLCAPVLLGLDFQSHLKSVTMAYDGPLTPIIVVNPQFCRNTSHTPLLTTHTHRPALPTQHHANCCTTDTTCGLSTLRIPPPPLFANLTPDCKPVAIKSRRYSAGDRAFIKSEVQRLLREGVTEASTSPWRAQVVVVRNGEKNRMVVDYSQIINRFTQLNAYPLPRIADMADGRLYHFLRIPFGVTNGVSVFQRAMDRMVDQCQLKATFPYLDNITIYGHNQQDHNNNLQKFLQAAEVFNLTYNKDKCVFGTTRLAILGCVVENGVIGPDPDRMRPLLELPLPNTLRALKRCLGFFSYYAQWVSNYTDKARPLVKPTTFPLSAETRAAVSRIKGDIAKAAMHAVDEAIPFQVESEASDFVLAATLNQAGRPVAFFSRTLQGPDIRHSPVEKEAQAIVEACLRHEPALVSELRLILWSEEPSLRIFSYICG
ncbi:uncharacterized protein LOC134339275 [Mobula hypostoma]|uniref:uncharacterized protein LOC134339275 n=1 Tax=Mobula hypostoma TaxID=723540 RepID=UPI002FC39662